MLVFSFAWSWPAGRLAVEIEERRKTPRFTADDRQRHRQAERTGTGNRLRRATDGNPERQRVLQRAGIDAAAVDRRTHLALPGHRFAVAQRHEQIELFLEQLVVIFEIVAEEREGFDEGAAPRHHLRPAVRQEVEGGELLEHPHRIVRAQDGDGAGQPDVFGLDRSRGQDGRRRRGGVIRPVMFAEPEDVEAHLVGQLDFLQKVLQSPRPFRPLCGSRRIDIRESIKTEFHIIHLLARGMEIGMPAKQGKCKIWKVSFENFDGTGRFRTL